MAKTLCTLSALVAGASAFTGPVGLGRPARAATASKQVTMMAGEYTSPEGKSASIPFMPQPANLDGTLAGDVGFDPFGFSDWINLDFLREAELKHGRICQLAVTGWIAADLGLHLPGDVHDVSSLEAHDAAVKYGAMSQLLLWISAFEAVSTVAVVDMIKGSGRAPGDFGFDPLNLTKNPAKKADLELKEITHCRLAMLAFSGLVTQAALTGKGFPYF